MCQPIQCARSFGIFSLEVVVRSSCVDTTRAPPKIVFMGPSIKANSSQCGGAIEEVLERVTMIGNANMAASAHLYSS